jgi:putative membrane protein
MRWLLRVLFAAGLLVAVYLMSRTGFGATAQLLADAGWKLLLLVPLHAAPLFLDVVGWYVLVVPRNRLGTLFFIATVREAFNRLLPVANIGGELAGIRMLTQRGTDPNVAAASIVVETLINLMAQFLFVSLGAFSLLQLTSSISLAAGMKVTLTVAILALAALYLILRYGSVFESIDTLARRIAAGATGSRWKARGARLDDAIRRILVQRRSLAIALAWQFSGLMLGCLETWLALRWLGHPVGWLAALVLESSTQAIRHFIFFVPAGLGVQEAGLILAGQILGIEAQAVIALSLAKRMREVLFGLPALMMWVLARPRVILRTDS